MAKTIPVPYGRDKATEKRLGRMAFRASTVVLDSATNERRQRAEIERAIRSGDDALAQIEARLIRIEKELGIIP